MTRYVIYSKTNGVYLESMLGFDFWSKLDPAGQDSAVVFETVEWARLFQEWSPSIKDIEIHAVECKNDSYATVEECAAAGLPRWNPRWRGE